MDEYKKYEVFYSVIVDGKIHRYSIEGTPDTPFIADLFITQKTEEAKALNPEAKEIAVFITGGVVLE
jgi:hypothetical protein